MSVASVATGLPLPKNLANLGEYFVSWMRKSTSAKTYPEASSPNHVFRIAFIPSIKQTSNPGVTFSTLKNSVSTLNFVVLNLRKRVELDPTTLA